MVTQSYSFENPDSFLQDFGVGAAVQVPLANWTLDGSAPTLDSGVSTLDGYGGYTLATATVILSQPGENILGGKIASNQYEIEYVTTELSLSNGTIITILGTQFSVLQTYMLDDGVFSRARIQT